MHTFRENPSTCKEREENFTFYFTQLISVKVNLPSIPVKFIVHIYKRLWKKKKRLHPFNVISLNMETPIHIKNKYQKYRISNFNYVSSTRQSSVKRLLKRSWFQISSHNNES